MKSKSFVDVEVGIDGVQKFNLDDGGEGEARYRASGQATTSCSMPCTAMVYCRVATAWPRGGRCWPDMAAGGREGGRSFGDVGIDI